MLGLQGNPEYASVQLSVAINCFYLSAKSYTVTIKARENENVNNKASDYKVLTITNVGGGNLTAHIN